MTKKLITLGKVFLLSILMINISCNKDDEIILNDSNFITSLKLTSGDFTKDFDIKDEKIDGSLPFYLDETSIALTVTISDKAKITPDPRTITSIKNPVNFVVTAENGEKRNYIVNIKRELSPENIITSFDIKTNAFKITTDVNNETGTINQRVFPNTDLTSIGVSAIISDNATISPNPETVLDYTNPVNFTVTAENGDAKKYVVTLEKMNEDFMAKCDIMNASHWFGGDDRTDPTLDPGFSPRNVGTGQTILLQKDTYPTKFGFFLTDPFRSDETKVIYTGDLELRLHIRNDKGNLIKTIDSKIIGPFNGGWVDFDLSSLYLLLKKGKPYYFTYYLVDGEALGITTGSSGNLNSDSGVCGNTGHSGTSRKRENTSLEDWNVWSEHPWHFNFRFEGKQ